MAEKFRVQQAAKLAAEAEQEHKKRLAIKDKVKLLISTTKY